MKQPSWRRPMPCSELLQTRAMLFLLTSYASVLCAVLGSVSSALLPGLEPLPTRAQHSPRCLRMEREVLEYLDGKKHHGGQGLCESPGSCWQIADSPRDKKQKASRDPKTGLCQTNCFASPKPSDRLVDSSPRRFCLRCVTRHGLLALGKPLVFYVFFAMVCVRHNEFILRVRNKDAELDVKMNPTLALQ